MLHKERPGVTLLILYKLLLAWKTKAILKLNGGGYNV